MTELCEKIFDVWARKVVKRFKAQSGVFGNASGAELPG